MADLFDVGRVAKSFIGHAASDLLHPQNSKGYIREWLTMNYRFVDRYPAIPAIELSELFPGVREMIVPMDVGYNYWNISPLELYLLGCIAISCKPKKIFEIGTYDGATSLQFAKCCPDSEIFTIDLPPQPDSHFKVGSRYTGTPYESQIVQLYGHSTKFDFSPYLKQMDLIFVDGAHEFEIVQLDSINALKMVRAGGIIVWDDYLNHRGVKRVIEELAKKYPIKHLSGTKFALLKTN
jgi:predicted O-methyltransferase YrrM